jgi:hypothetical protein
MILQGDSLCPSTKINQYRFYLSGNEQDTQISDEIGRKLETIT